MFINVYVMGLNRLLKLYREEFGDKPSKTLDHLIWLIRCANEADTTDED